MNLINKCLHTLESCKLCIKYPFLYPRKRFTDWNKKDILINPICYFYNKSVTKIFIHGKLEKENNCWFWPILRFFDFKVKIDKEKLKLYITKGKTTIEHDISKLAWGGDKFNILGISLIWNVSGNPVVIVHFKPKDENDEINYGFSHENIEFINNKFLYYIYNRFKWWDNLLDYIFILPTFTELDSMPEGWRKTFGITMCDEIKEVLKRYNCLYKYRIMQIKEKFGGLRWYDDNAPKEIDNIIHKYEQISYNTCI